MTDATGTTSWDYTYDGVHLTAQTTPQGTVYSAFDADGRRKIRQLVGTGSWTYTYDNGGRLLTESSPSDGTTTFVYDGPGSRGTRDGNGLTQYGLLSSKTKGSGDYELYTYDTCNELKSTGYWFVGGTMQNALVYGYDPAGNVQSVNQGYYTATYGYDGADQLVSETNTNGRSGAPPSLGYTYDHNGNRLTRSSSGTVVQSFTYNSHDVLTNGTAGSETDGYDLNGNETSVTINGETYSFVWDDEDRLTSLAVPGVGTNTFTYNGLGLRVGKTDSTGTYSYVCDGTSPGSPVLSDGHATYTPGLSENRGGTSAYYSNDRIGNLWTLDGASKNQLSYEDDSGFGGVVAGGNPGTPFGFGGANGCQTDADTGLVLMGHRYYDSRIGRFISQDPAGEGDNWYAYAGNNPVNHIDPTGLYVENPEPTTDQTQGAVMFAQAFYGDQSGLSNFFEQESQSEQRGALQYVAQQAIDRATITGDGNFGSQVQGLLSQIASTNFGANLLAQFFWEKLPLRIVSDYGDPNGHFVQSTNFNGTIVYDAILFNPNLIASVYTTDGWQNIPSDVTLEHEMGHDIVYERSGNEQGIDDPGPGGPNGTQNSLTGTDVISVYENPYRSEKGLSLRINHAGIPISW